MANTGFPRFHSTYPPVGGRAPYDDSRHGDAAARVPPELAEEWRNFGFGAYGDGLIWTTPPDRPLLDQQDWPGLTSGGIEVLRTAFASVCLWQEGTFVWLNVHTGKIGDLGDSAPILFDAGLPNPDFRKEVLLQSLFSKLRKKLGDIDVEECYGFAPLPALGGDSSVEHAIKTDIRSYVALAAQALG